jgi:hypothetical protein
MRKIILLFLFIINCIELWSQFVASSTISSFGGSVRGQGIHLIWSAGQGSLITYEKDEEGLGCRQGFIQPVVYVFNKTENESINIFDVYPNPASDFLYIRNLMDIHESYSLCLFNSIGSCCLDQPLTGDLVSEIDISGLKDGLYLLRLSSQNRIYSFKIIIMKK